MREHFSDFFKQILIYGLGQFAGQAAGFFLIPVYTRHLSVEEYGVLAILMACVAFLSMFLNFGMGSAVFKYYFATQDEGVRRQILGTAYIMLFAAALIICSALVPISEHLSRWIFASSAYTDYFRLVLIVAFLNTASIIPFAYFRAEGKAGYFAFLGFLKFIVTLGAIILLIVHLNLGVWGALLGTVFASAAIDLLLFLATSKQMRFRFSIDLAKKLLLFGLPLMPAQIFSWNLTTVDRFILQGLTDSETVGIYSLGYKIGLIFNVLVVAPFAVAWGPFLFSKATEPNAKDLYSRLLNYYVAIAGFLALAIAVFSKQIVQVLATPSYSTAAQIIPIVVFSYYLYGMYYIFTTGLNIEKKTYYFPFITGLSALLNVALNFTLIPVWGMLGAAYATAAAYLFMAVLTLLFSHKYYPIDFNWLRVLPLVLAWAVLVGAAALVRTPGLLQGVLRNLVILTLFALLVFSLGTVRSKKPVGLK